MFVNVSIPHSRACPGRLAFVQHVRAGVSAKEMPMKIKCCLICGKTFESHNRERTCSDICRKKDRSNYWKKRYEKDPTSFNEKSKRWRKKNPNWFGEYNQKNKVQLNKLNRLWRQKNRERLNARRRFLRALNPEKANERNNRLRRQGMLARHVLIQLLGKEKLNDLLRDA
jgi:hypothetical protein